MTTTDTTLHKQVKTAFGKQVYLLGRFKDGFTFWLEEPTWDCGWYWGFGYVETYTCKAGPPAKDIQSHQHYDGLCFKKPERYSFEHKTWVLGEYVHILSDHPDVEACVLSKPEQWILSDLMKTAYTLKEAAEVFRHGNGYISGNAPALVKDTDLKKRINEVELPKVFKAIATLLTPQEST